MAPPEDCAQEHHLVGDIHTPFTAVVGPAGSRVIVGTGEVMSLGRALSAAREARGLSLSELAARVACAKSYLSQIEQGKNAGTPSGELLRRLESALGVRAGEFVERAAWRATPAAVRERVVGMQRGQRAATELVRLLRERGGKLDDLYRSGVLANLVSQVDPGAGIEEPKKGTGVKSDPSSGAARRGVGGAMVVDLPVQVPLINSVAAGYPREFTDLGYPARVADSYVLSPDICDADAFACRVVGDSMTPEYREGDIVIFSPARQIKSGMDCFVRFERDAETTFKRVYFEDEILGSPAVPAGPASGIKEDPAGTAGVPKAGGHGRAGEIGSPPPTPSLGEGGKIRLQPLNGKYAPRVVGREEVAGLYAAVSVMRSVG